ncbi:MAG TPA: hypothetical protein DHN33_03325, partial [Eubacteriaceae bacterium]|nr:hypothetical protein [Eubacteriaceae bacterium]
MLGKLRFHLVLLNTLVLTLILVAISVFLYITMSLNLRSNVESELFLAAEQMSSYVDYFDGVKRGLPIEEEKEESYSELNQKLLNENIATIVWDENFEILRSSVYISI